MERNILGKCQELLGLLHQKRVSNEELKEEFKRKFEEILKVISQDEGYKIEVESHAESRLLQHERFDEELEEIEFKLEEINIEDGIVEDELEKIERELENLSMNYRFTKVFFWE